MSYKAEVCNEACVSTRGGVLGARRQVLRHWRMVVESCGQTRRSEGLNKWSCLPGTEQHRVLADGEEAASACDLHGRNVWFDSYYNL